MSQKSFLSHLVVGYGNRLRADDGVGFMLAEEISQWKVPSLRVVATHQLCPELASEISRADRVIFIDARARSGEDRIDLRRLHPGQTPSSIDHALSPERLLILAQALYGTTTPAWTMTIPAYDFSWQENLSPRTARLLPEARQSITRWLELTPTPAP